MSKARDIADGVDTADIADGAISTAKLADNSINATKINVSGNGTAGQFLSSDGDGTMTWADAGGGFDLGTALTGTTPTIDWSSATAFSHTLTGDTTYSFSNVPSGGEIELFIKNVGKQYNLTTPTSLSSVSFAEFSSTDYHTLFFNNDGSKMYVGTNAGTYPIYQYSLSTNYDISTKTYDSVSATGGSVTAWAFGSKEFNGDGTKMIAGFSNFLYEYSLSTAYDISTLSTTANYSIDITSLFRSAVGTSTPYIQNIKFFNDGYSLYLGSQRHNGQTSFNTPFAITINLSTAYDINSTLTLDSYLFQLDPTDRGNLTYADGTVITEEINTSISDDGYVLSILSSAPITSTDKFVLIKCNLSTPFDLGTATINTKYVLDLSGQTQLHYGQMLPDGKTFTWAQNTTGRGIAQRLDISGDYTIAFPSGTSEVPATIGAGPDPSTTSYVRMVSLDGTNVLITDHKEIV